MKYESIKNADIENEVEYKGEKGYLHDVILSIQNGSSPLFTGVEQGSGRARNRVYLLIVPRFRREA